MACDKNPEKIKNMFDKISPYYDKMNNFISLGMHYYIKKSAIQILKINPNAMVLDMCCGTGDFTGIINKIYPKAKVIGLDNSRNMIKIAKQKYPQKAFIIADCTDLPFSDNEFDLIVTSFGLRNVENRKKAIEETFRTLKNNGIFLNMDFGNHNKINKIFDFIIPYIVKLAKADPESYNYLIKSKNSYPEPDELIEEFSQCGFRFLEKRNYLMGAISCQIMVKKD